MKESYLILHNIRSVYNVGAIFRTADALGISKIFLTGYTPAPLDRFGRIRKDVSKSALGAEKNVPWEQFENIGTLIKKLKSEKVFLVAIEQDERSVDYKKAKIKYPTAFILGNEVEGLTKNILDKSDLICEIPMRGKKESLNVSVSAGVALFRILNI
ncbi:MAG: TrmH family RNA methyltransferase [Candidatus Paceibacterota bacterium]